MTSPSSTTRPTHTPRVPSLTLPSRDVSPTLESRSPVATITTATTTGATTSTNTTPPIVTTTLQESPFYRSPKSPRLDHGHQRTQSRRTLGNWQLGKTIGQGSMGRVRLGHNIVTGEQVAVKIIPRPPSESSHGHSRKADVAPRPKDENREVRAIREAAIVTLLRHPYICGMRDVVITQGHFYLFFEYVDGGQMLDYIISHGKLREKHARKFARQILSALDYCHRNSIVHRDLKIENILISKSGNIKIIDFGLSNLYSNRSLLTTYCGSLYFAAPELLNAHAYTGPEVDIWSFGIVLYVLVCGKVPFDDQSMAALHAKIKRGVVEYPSWLSSECKNLLSRILVVDASKRATFPEIAQHPWMSKGGEGPIENYFPTRLPLTPPLDDEVIRSMRGFEFGTEDDIREKLTAIIQSSVYLKASEQYLRFMENATSAAIAEKSEKRKPFSLEFYKRKSSPVGGSWSELSAASASSLNFEDPTSAFHPLLSVYYLVQEKQDRDRQAAESPSRTNASPVSSKSERTLRIPTIPVPEAAHTGDVSYEITNSPGRITSRPLSTPSRAKPRDDSQLSPVGMVEPTPLSPKPRLFEELTGGKSGSLLRRISHKWSREPVKDVRKEAKTPLAQFSIPHVEIATPKKSLSGKKSREIERYMPSTPQSSSPAKMRGGLGRSTSISEGQYRSRNVGATSDDEFSSNGSRSDRLSNSRRLSISISPKSAPGGRTRSAGHARHATVSAARRANERHDRDFWSGPLSGPSTIPEETKEGSRDLLNQPSSIRDDQYARPVHLKSLFSVATTSTKPVQKMRSDLLRVLDQLGISHEEIKGGFFCMHRPSIALESVQEPTPHIQAEEFYAGKKSRRRLSLGAPIAAAAQFAGFGAGDKRVRHETESDISGESVIDFQGGGGGREDVSGPGGAMVVRFEIYIVKFPLLSLHGIQFKRVGGDVWQYKNACVKILGELKW